MKKRVLSTVLSAALALALVPTAAFAAEDFPFSCDEKSDQLVWQADETIDYYAFDWSTEYYIERTMTGINHAPNGETFTVTHNGTSGYGRIYMDKVILQPEGETLWISTSDGEYTEQNVSGKYVAESMDSLYMLLYPLDDFSSQYNFSDGYGHIWTRFEGKVIRISAGESVTFTLPEEKDTIYNVIVEYYDSDDEFITNRMYNITYDKTTTPVAPGEYKMQKYDTWGQIALNNYGTYGVWKQLCKANNNVKLTAGTVITLPEKLGKYNRIEAPVLAEGEKLYTVKAGDTLGTIAKATYGNAMKYKEIFERNTDRLKNANTIFEGQTIVLPVVK